MIEHQERVTSLDSGINKLNMVIDWELFRKELESLLDYDTRDLPPRRVSAIRFGACAHFRLE